MRAAQSLHALAWRACDVTVRCWEPWCEELFALPIALLFGVSGPSWGSFWGDLGAHLDCLGAFLGRLGALLGASCAVLWRSWGPLGPSWPLLRHKSESAENVRFPKRVAQFWLSGALLGSILEPSWGVLGASWAVLKPSSGVLGPIAPLLFFNQTCHRERKCSNRDRH